MRFFLSYCILVLFYTGCKEHPSQSIEQNNSLFPEPLVVPLNTSGGYTVNKLTGDSIKPLISQSGDTFKTAVPVPFISTIIDNEILQPEVIEGFRTIKTTIEDNVYPIPAKLSVVKLDTSKLRKIKLGEGDTSYVLKNSMGIVQTGVPLPVTGKKMPFSEPQPVKALPMRYKDNATASIQFMDVDQGLSYSYVYALHEDKNGNLWFGMDGTGLSKYDGISFINYTEKTGLINNIVISIAEDTQKRLWLGTEGGISCFDGKTFTRYTEEEGLLSNSILRVFTDKKGNIWFCSLKGISKYDGYNITHYSRKEGLLCNSVYSCLEDSKGNIWMATDSGAVKFDGSRFTYYSMNDGMPANIISALSEDKDGNIWFGFFSEGLCKFDGTTFTYYRKGDGLSNASIRSMMNDSKGNIWIGTLGGGMNKFDGKKFTRYSLEQGLSSSKIRQIIEDKNGNIWLGTEGGGINKFNATNFEYQFPESLVENNRIRPILKDRNGHLWFGTDAGHIGKLEMANKADGASRFIYYMLQKNSSDGQRSLIEDKNGNIWIGTNGSGIIKYDGSRFLKYSLGAEPVMKSIYDILNDKNGNTWFGVRDGTIVRFDGKKFSFYTTKNGLPGRIIYSMLEVKKGNIWFCSESGGIYKYDGKDLIVYSAKEGLFNQSITSIAEDDNGNIWLGTLGAGVCKFDGENFTYYSKEQGLADNNVWSVFCDSANHLWFGTDKGLSLCIPQSDSSELSAYTFYNFGAQDGLKAIDFNLHSFSVDNANRIWWGTGKGVPSFDLNKTFHADSVRSLSLSYIEINERYYDFHNLDDKAVSKISFSSIAPFHNYPDGLTLHYNQNHLTFHFSAIDWSAPGKINYSFRLLRSDENWSSPSPIAFADYRNLQHGNYTLQVKAIGRSQIWSKTFNYDFTILPPWWLTWWFKSFVGLLLVIAIFLIARFIYKYQLRKQKNILEKQLAVQYERQRISTEMHDDIGAGLSGVRLLTEMTKNKLKNTDATGEIDKIYESVGDISAKMKEVIWSLNTENDNLGNLVFFIQKQVRSQLEHYPGEISFDIPATFPDIQINGEVRRNVYLAVKEAVHNIIKHSGADKIKLSITADDSLVITVADNGKGLDIEKNKSTGNGMRNMYMRMKNINGSLLIKNGKGTILTFKIPLKTGL